MDTKTHLYIALFLGFATLWVLDKLTLRAFLVPGIAGIFVGAILPDILEPAAHWTHRGRFHSIKTLKIVGIIILLSFFLLWVSSIFSWIFFGAIGYGSHLLLDATTPMGLPKK